MPCILFDEHTLWQNFLPLTFTRPISQLRIGALTLSEKWERHLNMPIGYLTQEYLQEKYPLVVGEENLLINSSILPTDALVKSLRRLKVGEALRKDNILIAIRTESQEISYETLTRDYSNWDARFDVQQIKNRTDIFLENGKQIQADFNLIKKRKKSKAIVDEHTRVYKSENIFIEEGVKLRACLLNAEDGPIYIAKNAEIQENVVIHGPVSIGESAVVNMGAKIRANTTIGPYCKVGGELSNSMLMAYSNKAHDGFLGNSVLGEWCNLGADTNNSNLKNNYSTVKLWNYTTQNYEDSGLQFCGLFMGDHSKAGINTMFNTGTVVGVASNVFGGNFPPKYIPSFAWGGAESMTDFQLDKVLEMAKAMMIRKQIELTETDQKILEYLYNQGLSEKSKELITHNGSFSSSDEATAHN